MLLMLIIAMLGAAYSIRGGWEAIPLPSWGLQLAGRLGVWGGGLATAYLLQTWHSGNLWLAAWFMAAGFIMMFIPHRYVMTAGKDPSPPYIIKPELEQHWPTAWWPWHPDQKQWDSMPDWRKCLHHTWQTAFVMLLRCAVTFIPYAIFGSWRAALLASAIIVALCPISNILGFRIIPLNKDWGGATKAEEVIHGAIWGLAFTQL